MTKRDTTTTTTTGREQSDRDVDAIADEVEHGRLRHREVEAASCMTDLGWAGHRVEPVAAPGVDEPGLRDRLLDLWVAVTDAGGSVGFAAPADREAIGHSLDDELEFVRRGIHLLAVVRDGDEVVAMGFLWGRGNPIFAHWRTVMRLMVRPDVQGRGLGSHVLTALHDLARANGSDHLVLSVRGDEGLEPFYVRHGYREIGRHVAAVRMPDGTDRDEIQFLSHLDGLA